ncbi:hypothetical protein BCV70DRAFT_201617 [Testicularia cyperi]|uniref:Uncharacterized protein n=1 Tax=Testicularia cyperi TaxID=1882483 RepID=A0A317XKI3_9BASI|nr:hypothetical protein BCV70DRAFT_201617 [Testicularia cyperi]
MSTLSRTISAEPSRALSVFPPRGICFFRHHSAAARGSASNLASLFALSSTLQSGSETGQTAFVCSVTSHRPPSHFFVYSPLSILVLQ